MNRRVVITGLGVVAPNGVGVEAFLHAIKSGISGIRFDQDLADLHFSCQISGKPIISDQMKVPYFSELELRNFNASGILASLITSKYFSE
jgi:3-oxoacyl-(acyl-carrier-protein) synthase